MEDMVTLCAYVPCWLLSYQWRITWDQAACTETRFDTAKAGGQHPPHTPPSHAAAPSACLFSSLSGLPVTQDGLVRAEGQCGRAGREATTRLRGGDSPACINNVWLSAYRARGAYAVRASPAPGIVQPAPAALSPRYHLILISGPNVFIGVCSRLVSGAAPVAN